MKIDSIIYEEQYIELSNPEEISTVDSYLIKSSGEIFRKLNDRKYFYNKSTGEDFALLEKDILNFIDLSDHTVYFVDNTRVSIMLLYDNGTKQIVERGLAKGDEFFDSIIEDYIDEFVE